MEKNISLGEANNKKSKNIEDLLGEPDSGKHSDSEGNSFEITACSVKGKKITVDIRYAGRKYVGTDCDRIKMSVEKYKELKLGLKSGKNIKELLNYKPGKDDADYSDYQSNEKGQEKAKLTVIDGGGEKGDELDQDAEAHIIAERDLRASGEASKEDANMAPEDLIVGPVVGNFEDNPEEKNVLSDPKKGVEAEEIAPEPEVGFKSFFSVEDINKMSREKKLKKQEEQEKEEKLVELKTLVKEKRIACAREDYKNTNHFKRLKEILGLGDKQNPFNNKETFAYQQYQGALNEYRSLKIQSLKDEYANIDNLPEKERVVILAEMKEEMGKLATYFGIDEKIELAAARTDARTESWAETKMGRLGKGALDWSAKRVNDYRTMDRKKKIAISVALFSLGGIGAISGSVGIVSAVALSKGIQRWLGGAALGAGIATSLESWSRTKAKQKVEGDKNEIINKEEWTEKLNALSEYCSKEMRTFHESLQKEKSGATKRKLLGVGVGVFVGSGAAADCAKWGFGKIGETETFGKIKDVATGLWKSSGASGIVGAGIESVKAHNPFSSPVAETPANAPAASYGADKLTESSGSRVSLPNENIKPSAGPVSEIKETPLGDDLNSAKPKLNQPEAKVVVSDKIKLPEVKVGGDGIKVTDLKEEDAKLKASSITDKIKSSEAVQEGNLDPNASPLAEAEKSSADLNAPKTAEVGAPDAKLVDVPNPEVNANIAEVEITKGGSIEKTIIKQLQERGIFNKSQAGDIAHRMALKYADEHNISFAELNHVKAGDVLKLEIDPDNLEGMKIADLERVSGGHGSGLPASGAAAENHSAASANGGADAEKGEHTQKVSGDSKLQDVEKPKVVEPATPNSVEDAKPKIHHSPKVDNNTSPFVKAEEQEFTKKRFPPNMEFHKDSDSAAVNPEEKTSFPPKPREEDYVPSLDNAEFTPVEFENIKEIGKKLGGSWIDTKAISNQLLALKHLEGERFYKMYARVMGNMASGIFKDHGINSLEALSHINAREYISSGDNPKVAALIEYGKAHFKDYNFEPRSDEAMDSWTMRVLRKTMESCGVSPSLGIRKG